jgi:hypothetical protein
LVAAMVYIMKPEKNIKESSRAKLEPTPRGVSATNPITRFQQWWTNFNFQARWGERKQRNEREDKEKENTTVELNSPFDPSSSMSSIGETLSSNTYDV